MLSTNCSWLSKRRASSPDDYSTTLATEAVPLSQYQELLKRHEELTERHRLLQQELSRSSSESPQLIGELSMAKDSPELAETVDVFQGRVREGQEARPAPVAAASSTRPIIDSRNIDSAIVEEEILILRNSNQLIAQNRYDQALRELRKIENSSVRQIRARAKYNMGEILFQQGEFDLAMQIFEDVIRTEAFSGIILKTLGRLIVCSEQLNLDQKKETYYSMLYDFFEHG